MGSGGTVQPQAPDQRWLSGWPRAARRLSCCQAHHRACRVLPLTVSSVFLLGSCPLCPATLHSPSACEECRLRFSGVTCSRPVVHPLSSGLGHGEPDTTCSGWESPRAASSRRASAPPSAATAPWQDTVPALITWSQNRDNLELTCDNKLQNRESIQDKNSDSPGEGGRTARRGPSDR